MHRENRRTFLKRLGSSGAGWALGRTLAPGLSAWAQDSAPAQSRPSPLTSGGPVPESAKSVVADLRDEMIVAGAQIHEKALLSLIDRGVALATRRESAQEAWRSLLKPDDVIGIKFDAIGYEELATTDIFASQLIASLEKAGFDRKRIVLIDVPAELAEKLGTQPRRWGWQQENVAFGSGQERLAAVLDQVTALINVPFLKTDNIFGIAGCLKNISLPFVRRQSRYFRNGGAPAIAEIVACPAIRSKLRLHLVNGLRAVFDRGPEVRRDCVWRHDGILVSTDPVASDTISLDLINSRRLDAKLPPIAGATGYLAHVRAAAQRGLGTDDQDYIRLLAARNA